MMIEVEFKDESSATLDIDTYPWIYRDWWCVAIDGVTFRYDRRNFLRYVEL